MGLSTTKMGTQANRKERRAQQKLLTKICTRQVSLPPVTQDIIMKIHSLAEENRYHGVPICDKYQASMASNISVLLEF